MNSSFDYDRDVMPIIKTSAPYFGACLTTFVGASLTVNYIPISPSIKTTMQIILVTALVACCRIMSLVVDARREVEKLEPKNRIQQTVQNHVGVRYFNTHILDRLISCVAMGCFLGIAFFLVWSS